MDNVAIRVENLGKCYSVPRAVAESDLTNMDRLKRKLGVAPAREQDFWAVRNLNFTIQKGEVVGLVGKNGAGKSTTLKVLSRITEPSEGIGELHGRLGSLLEVGTGFHPELTGRENVFLNGAILGMSHREIQSKFDEIVDFAGVEEFLDLPVKRYSSGMYVRLAFAVAAHLATEIMIVDEVLAVGDSEFQNKCLGKMQDVAHEGRTVLLVSHNMYAVRRFCTRCIWLKDGTLYKDGPTEEIVSEYMRPLDAETQTGFTDLRKEKQRYGDGSVRFDWCQMLDDTGEQSNVVLRGRTLTVRFGLHAERPQPIHVTVSISTDAAVRALHLSHHDGLGREPVAVSGSQEFEVQIPDLPLAAGNYFLYLAAHTPGMGAIDVLSEVMMFTVEDPPESLRPYATSSNQGVCVVPSRWQVRASDGAMLKDAFSHR